ncbi:MAG: phospho-N-acetylmuramoyl-pentapeptide-transferase [Clostridia bacterium]|nr:phospho-N-acetylmuramoyl-pentapeptide-transferase [Clostridia bacterium]
MSNYISIISAVAAFLITALSGLFVIPLLRKLKFGQTILEDGPTWHEGKQGTPTMGGIMIIAGVVISVILCVVLGFVFDFEVISHVRFKRYLIMLIAGVVMSLMMAAIGFIDDFIKIKKERNLGLTAKQKTFLQLAVSALYLVAVFFAGVKDTYIPFVGFVSITSSLGLLFWPIALFFVYGFVNAVNLTDGIDGLASGVTLVVSCFFMLISGALQTEAIGVLAAALAGACAGFILWNAKPAKVFMGDTGSLFLGGMVVNLAFMTERPVYLLLVGIVYLVEAISVMLQVAHFKRTGKRLFKMAPIHHHFEMNGWSEQKIVYVFSGVTFVACAIVFTAIMLNI